MTRILLAGLLGALVAFIWSSVLHMNPLTAALGLSTFNDKEDAVLAELRSQDLSPGLYFFPGMDMSKSMTKEQEAALMRLLNQLDPPLRSVLLLHFIEEFSLAEIAGITAVPLGTVKSRLHYAKKALRKLLEDS